ncbi:MAG: septum formation inhibitor Maf [Hahellaceae bacterium]|nr:septum formation inhibitor Maf [Hahellaceae bacterium]
MLPLVLASTSPRRQELLGRLGLPFSLCNPDIDENPRDAETVADYVVRMACEKASGGGGNSTVSTLVLGADTVGELGSELLLKPASPEAAIAMLSRMSGQAHWVHTAFAFRSTAFEYHACVSTRVLFRSLSGEEIRDYCRLGEGLDKAGAYAIQGRAASFVASIEGSYTAVVGLPLSEVSAVLQQLGYRVWKE